MPSPERYDLIIVGGGPAGLSAAVNAAYEGMETLVLDGKGRFGGQAGQASLIENYAGFPQGIAGYDLASKMIDQAHGLGADFQAPVRVDRIERSENNWSVRDDTEAFLGRAVLISSGVEYRKHNAKNLAVFLGRGVSYGSPYRGATYTSQKLVVVGGANSAGQAAAHLSKFTDCTVHVLIRGSRIEDKMSAKLIEKLEQAGNIEVHTQTEIIEAKGRGRLQSIVVKTGDIENEMAVDEIFMLIGAIPRTGWLPVEVVRDKNGYVVAGGNLPTSDRAEFAKGCGRQPYALETSMPGLFVAGDVRSSSVKRVANATGEGAIVIPEVHQYISEIK